MWSLVIAAAAAQQTCAPTTIGTLAQEPRPVVIVAGARKGSSTDAGRAWRLVKRLAAQGPVTVALEPVHRDQQAALDQWGQGHLPDEGLADRLGVADHWGFAADPFLRLITAHKSVGATVVAIGATPAVPARDELIPQPPAYMHVLADTMSGAPIPVELEGRFMAMVARHDHLLATAAIQSWSGDGALVIVADRLHVEGGKGVSWQAGLLQSAPVHNVLLARSDTPCFTGDLTLR